MTTGLERTVSLSDEELLALRESGHPALVRVFERVEVAEGRAVACPHCGRVSWNPNDVEQRYCGCCGYHGMPTKRADVLDCMAEIGTLPAELLR